MRFDQIHEAKIPETFMTDIMINDAYIFMYSELSALIPAYKTELKKQLENRERIERRLKREYFPVGTDLTNAYYYISYSEKMLSIFSYNTAYPDEINVDLTFAGDEFFERIQRGEITIPSAGKGERMSIEKKESNHGR